MVMLVTKGRSSVCGHDIWVAFMIHEERLLYTLQRSRIHHPQPCLSLGLNEVSQRDTCGACKLTIANRSGKLAARVMLQDQDALACTSTKVVDMALCTAASMIGPNFSMSTLSAHLVSTSVLARIFFTILARSAARRSSVLLHTATAMARRLKASQRIKTTPKCLTSNGARSSTTTPPRSVQGRSGTAAAVTTPVSSLCASTSSGCLS